MVILETQGDTAPMISFEIPAGSRPVRFTAIGCTQALPFQYLLYGETCKANEMATRSPPLKVPDGIFGTPTKVSEDRAYRTLDYYRAVACLRSLPLDVNASAVERAGAKWLGLCWSGLAIDSEQRFIALCADLLSLDLPPPTARSPVDSRCHLAAQMMEKFKDNPLWFTVSLAGLPPDPVFGLFPQPSHITIHGEDPRKKTWESGYKVGIYLEAAYAKSGRFKAMHREYGPLWPLGLPDEAVVPPFHFSVSARGSSEFIVKAPASPLTKLPPQSDQTGGPRVGICCVNDPNVAWQTCTCTCPDHSESVEGDGCICRQSYAWIVNLGVYTIRDSDEQLEASLRIQRGLLLVVQRGEDQEPRTHLGTPALIKGFFEFASEANPIDWKACPVMDFIVESRRQTHEIWSPTDVQ